MVGCSIRKCKSKSVKGGTISFYAFPREESLAKEWRRHCGAKTTIKNGRICSNHFLPSDFTRPLRHILLNEHPKKYRYLNPDAVPTVHINDTDEEDSTSKSVDAEENVPNVSIEAMTPIVEISCSDNSSECNTVSTYATAGSSHVIEQSINCITIPLAEYKQLKRTFKEYDTLKKNLENIFTPGQIRSLMKPKSKRRVKWSAEDIAAAASLKNMSPKGYEHLRANIGIPLPAFSTLRNWTSKFGLKEELLEIFLCDENDETEEGETEKYDTEEDLTEDITEEGRTEENKTKNKTKEDIKTTLRVVNLSKLLDTN